jgi:hypothetical protein
LRYRIPNEPIQGMQASDTVEGQRHHLRESSPMQESWGLSTSAQVANTNSNAALAGVDKSQESHDSLISGSQVFESNRTDNKNSNVFSSFHSQDYDDPNEALSQLDELPDMDSHVRTSEEQKTENPQNPTEGAYNIDVLYQPNVAFNDQTIHQLDELESSQGTS